MIINLIKNANMKRVTVPEGHKALKLKNGELAEVLEKGSYWLGFGATVEMYSLRRAFESAIPLELLLQKEQFVQHVHVVSVADHEVALVYQEGRFLQVLESGVHVFWKGLVDYSFVVHDMSTVDTIEAIAPMVLKKTEMTKYIRAFEVEPHQQALLFISGMLSKTLVPGQYFFWKNAIAISLKKIDVRTQQIEISGQEMLTKDKAAIRINYEVQYQVVDIEKALADTEDYQKQLYVLVQLALRGYVGSFTLDTLLEKREEIAGYVQSQLAKRADALGLKIHHSGMKDVILTGEMKTIMNKVLMAQKQAEANVIMRSEETASTRSLMNTAKLMEENSMLYKLKEMEYMEKIAERIDSISVSGGGQVAGQLKELFAVNS